MYFIPLLKFLRAVSLKILYFKNHILSHYPYEALYEQEQLKKNYSH